LLPGHYELIIYTHECITNMDPGRSTAISSFDLRLQMSVRLLRLADQRGSVGSAASSPVPVEILDYSQNPAGQGARPHLKDSARAAPLVVTQEELGCLKEYLPLPESLEALSVAGSVDISEAFYIPMQSYHAHEISFTAREGQDALRILLAKANSKIAVYEKSGRALAAQSRPVEAAKAQLLIATELRVGTAYTILLEFSEQVGGLDGEGAGSCDHFEMALRTWDSQKACSKATSQPNPSSLMTSPNSEPQTTTLLLTTKVDYKELRVDGTGPVDLQITLDYSDAFYRTEMSLKAASSASHNGQYQSGFGGEEVAALAEAQRDLAPTTADFSKKHSTTYLFTDIPAGKYELKLRQRFKDDRCASSVAVILKSWTAASGSISLDRGGVTGQNLYQSQAEEQERPRTANKLPLNLSTYKFMGGERESLAGAGGYLLFSGPVQLDELESQNNIAFTVDKNDTLIRLYVENAGIALSLHDTSSEHAK